MRCVVCGVAILGSLLADGEGPGPGRNVAMDTHRDDELVFDDRESLWRSPGFEPLSWYDGSEDYLADVFARVETVSDYPVELAEYIKDWPSRYHLSHIRVNFLEALGEIFSPQARVLELGGGMGAITTWLAEHSGAVDVLEGSLPRARANRLRNRGRENVRVILGDMIETPFPQVYDLVTLIGVLEYTERGVHPTRRDACRALLEKVRANLAPGGVLMIAIENRLGAKYWAGCSEDHTSGLFDGLLEYPDDTPVTFSRRELESLIAEAGFSNQQFYHVFPDYKLPSTVIREGEVPPDLALHQLAMGLGEDYMRTRQYLMPDPLLLKSVEDAGLLWEFSNSFVVLCSSEDGPALATPWIAKKFSNGARPEMHHTISMHATTDGVEVRREPMRDGVRHVELPGYTFDLSDAAYVSGSLLAVEAYAALVSRDPVSGLVFLARDILSLALAEHPGPSTSDVPWMQLVSGEALDLTFWNVVRDADGTLRYFDRKWSANEPIPVDHLLFRNLFWFLVSAAPFVNDELMNVIAHVMRIIFPGYDEGRIEQLHAEETRFQQLVHSDRQERVVLGPDGLLMIPDTSQAIAQRLARLEALEAELEGAPGLAAVSPTELEMRDQSSASENPDAG